jgi:hypothetical protein
MKNKYSHTQNKEAVDASRMLVPVSEAAWCYISENNTVYNQKCENLRSDILLFGKNFKYGSNVEL